MIADGKLILSVQKPLQNLQIFVVVPGLPNESNQADRFGFSKQSEVIFRRFPVKFDRS